MKKAEIIVDKYFLTGGACLGCDRNQSVRIK